MFGNSKMHLFYLEIHCHFQSTSYMHSGSRDVIYFKKTCFFENFIHGYSICIITSSQPILSAFNHSHSSSLSLHLMTSLTAVICLHTYAEFLQCCSCVWVFTNGHGIGQHVPREAQFSLSGCQLPSFVRFSPSMLECQLVSLCRSCVGDHMKISCTSLIIQNVKIIYYFCDALWSTLEQFVIVMKLFFIMLKNQNNLLSYKFVKHFILFISFRILFKKRHLRSQHCVIGGIGTDF